MSHMDLAMWSLGWSCIAAGSVVAVAAFRDAAREWSRIITALRGHPVPPRASGARPTASRITPRRIVEAGAALTGNGR